MLDACMVTSVFFRVRVYRALGLRVYIKVELVLLAFGWFPRSKKG